MNRTIRPMLWFLCSALLVLLPSAAFASPEAVVKEIVEKIKAAANPSPIVDYVDWSKAYEKMPPMQKTMMKVESANGMKEFYREMLTNPAAMMEKRMKEQAASMPEAQQAAMQQSMGQIQQMLKQRQDEMKKQITETEYKIGKATVEGEKATVKLTQVYQGDSKEREIQLNKVGEKWMLDSASMFAAPGPGGAPGGPPGGFPGGARPGGPPAGMGGPPPGMVPPAPGGAAAVPPVSQPVNPPVAPPAGAAAPATGQ